MKDISVSTKSLLLVLSRLSGSGDITVVLSNSIATVLRLTYSQIDLLDTTNIRYEEIYAQ